MKNLFFILTLFFALPCLAADCGSIKPVLELKSSYGKLRYDYGKDRSGITQISKKLGILEDGIFASGLATVDVSWEVGVDVGAQRKLNGKICVMPEKVTIFMGFQRPTVYISKDLIKDGCQYNLVMRHEQTHHQINKTTLDYYLPYFKSEVEKVINRTQPVYIIHKNELDSVTDEIINNYAAQIEPMVEKFKAMLIHQQMTLDNLSNYAYEDSLCLHTVK